VKAILTRTVIRVVPIFLFLVVHIHKYVSLLAEDTDLWLGKHLVCYLVRYKLYLERGAVRTKQ
jgi:hypothetical protein